MCYFGQTQFSSVKVCERVIKFLSNKCTAKLKQIDNKEDFNESYGRQQVVSDYTHNIYMVLKKNT